MKRYKVIACPHCGYVQSSAAYDTFSCTQCLKTRKFRSTKVIGLNIKVLASFDHPKDATLYVQEYKKQLAKKTSGASTEEALFSDVL